MGFWQDFTGASAKKDIRNSKAASDKQLDAGFAGATGFYNEAADIQDPFIAQGAGANKLLTGALGIGTAEERTAAQDTYFSDPVQERITGMKSNALLRNLNARGASGGGMAALAGQRVGLEGFNGWLDRLTGVGAQGQAAANTKSNIKVGQGDLNWGFGATKAGSDITAGNAMAASRGILGNNLLNIAGTAAKAFTGFRGA